MIIGISGKIGSGKDTVGKIIQYLTDKHYAGFTNPVSIDDFNSYLKNEHDRQSSWKIKKFAGKLKQCIAIILGIPLKDLEKEEVKNSILPECWDIHTKYPRTNVEKTGFVERLSVRQLLQRFGTEVGRSIHPNFWVNALFNEYKGKVDETKINWKSQTDAEKSIRDNIIFPNWLITDTRFPNEAKAIKDRGGIVIRVNRISSLPDDTLHKVPPFEHPSETALDNYTFDYVIDNNGTIEELITNVREILIKEKLT